MTLCRLFNKQILQYREEGYFKELWSEKGRKKTDLKRWKLQEMGCPNGPQNVDSNEKTLTFSTLIGIFYFLFIGLMIGISDKKWRTRLELSETISIIGHASHNFCRNWVSDSWTRICGSAGCTGSWGREQGIPAEDLPREVEGEVRCGLYEEETID